MSLLSQGWPPRSSLARQDTGAKKAFLRGIAVIGVLSTLAGCATGDNIRDADGRVVSAGEWSVFDLRPGDCLGPLSGGAGDANTVPLVPCEIPHTAEVFAIARYPDAEYPGGAEIAAYADNTCLTALEIELGLSVADGLGISYLLPTAEGWDVDGDRSVVCVVLSDEANPLVGSLVEGTAER